MPQFIVVAHDAKDDGAHERRLRIKESHTESVSRMRAEGKILLGLALTDENGKMIGSIGVGGADSKDAGDAILAQIGIDAAGLSSTKDAAGPTLYK